MSMTVAQLHKELGELIEAGAGDAVVRIEEVGEGYHAELSDVNTWMTGEHPTLTLLGEINEGGSPHLYVAETDTRHFTWRAAGLSEAEAREYLRVAYLTEYNDNEEGASTLAEEANVLFFTDGAAYRDDHRIE